MDNNITYVLSFDVGITNMGCCFLSCNHKTKTSNIIKWELINMIDTSIKSDKNTIITNETTKNTKISNKKKTDNSKKNTKTKTKTKTKASDVSLVTIGIAIEKKMDEFIDFSLYPPNQIHVVIENQIGPIAIRMKTIQGMLSQYFIMKGIRTIQYVSSSNKLKPWQKYIKSYSKFCDESEYITDTTYKQRKNHGIIVTFSILYSFYFSECREKIVKYMDKKRYQSRNVIHPCYQYLISLVEPFYIINDNIDIDIDIEKSKDIDERKDVVDLERYIYNTSKFNTCKPKIKSESIQININKREKSDGKWFDFFMNTKKKDDVADALLQGLWYANHSLYV